MSETGASEREDATPSERAADFAKYALPRDGDAKFDPALRANFDLGGRIQIALRDFANPNNWDMRRDCIIRAYRVLGLAIEELVSRGDREAEAAFAAKYGVAGPKFNTPGALGRLDEAARTVRLPVTDYVPGTADRVRDSIRRHYENDATGTTAMAVYDRWHLKHPPKGAKQYSAHRKVPSAEHGIGLRWQIRGDDQDGKPFKQNFDFEEDAKDKDAELRSAVRAGVFIDERAGSVTLRAFAEECLKNHVYQDTREGAAKGRTPKGGIAIGDYPMRAWPGWTGAFPSRKHGSPAFPCTQTRESC